MPREFTIGGVLDTTGGTQKCSWGNAFTSTTPVTAAFLLKLRSAGSASFDVLWGYSTARWFFVLKGDDPRKVAFNVITGLGERTSGYIGTSLDLDTWYSVIGHYDPDGGADNISVKVYNISGTSFATSSATTTGTFSATGNALVAGCDTVRDPDLPVNAQFKNFRLWGRILTSTEDDALAAGDEVDRTSLVLETLCNEHTGLLRNTATVNNTTQATLSGGATIQPTPPSQFARSRSVVSGRVSSTYDSQYNVLLNGSNQYINRDDETASTNGTFFIRFKTTNPSASGQTMVGISVGGSGNNNADLALNSGVPRVRININGSTIIHATLPFTTDTHWHSLLWKGGSGGNQIFFDGVDVTSTSTYVSGTSATTTWTSAFTSTITRITNGVLRVATDTSYFSGWLDDFKMWDRKLSDAECLMLHTGEFVSRTGLFWEWLYNENTGTTVSDTSATPTHTGTFINSPSWSSEVAFKPRVADGA